MAKFCGKCGTRLNEENGLCPNCDVLQQEYIQASKEQQSIEYTNANPSGSESKKKSKKSIAVFFIALVLLIVSVIGLLSHWGYIDIPLFNSLIPSNNTTSTKDNESERSSNTEQEITDESVTVENTTGVNADYTNLVADENDFNKLLGLLEKIESYDSSFEYSSTDFNAYQTILSELLNPYGGVPVYTYFYNKEPEQFYASDMIFDESPESERDPLQRFGKYYRYARVPADEMDWIIQTIFSVTPNRSNSTIIEYEECTTYYYDDYYYFACGDGGDIGVHPVIVNDQKDSNNVYTIKYDLLLNDDYNTYECSGRVVCALKNIDGKKQWILSSIEKID